MTKEEKSRLIGSAESLFDILKPNFSHSRQRGSQREERERMKFKEITRTKWTRRWGGVELLDYVEREEEAKRADKLTVRQLESAVEQKVVTGRIPRADHHSVFHDLLCVERDPLTAALLRASRQSTSTSVTPRSRNGATHRTRRQNHGHGLADGRCPSIGRRGVRTQMNAERKKGANEISGRPRRS